MQYQVVHCHSDVYSAAGEHSAECRTSWVCLQHLATFVTSNVVTICGSKFPPTVSKHCQTHAMPKTPQAIWNTNNSSCCDIQGAASLAQLHGSLQLLLICLSRPAKVQKSCHSVYSSSKYGHLLQTCSTCKMTVTDCCTLQYTLQATYVTTRPSCLYIESNKETWQPRTLTATRQQSYLISSHTIVFKTTPQHHPNQF